MGTVEFRNRRTLLGLATICCTAIAVSACGSSGASSKSTGSTAASQSGSGVTTSGISAERCTANKAAGPILFETSFDYAAAASILDVLTADKRGYFKDMCLDVQLKAGFSTDNVALVSANKVQISSLGSDSEVLAARAQKANLVGVLTYSKVPISELITPASAKVTNLTQLDGKTVGIKGALSYEIASLLAKAGVKISGLKQVQVGFDPTIIDKGRIAALPVYKSNEPQQLNKQHIKYDSFNPTDFGVAGSFGTVVANSSFAKQHPTALQDFLRADLRGFEWAASNQAQAVQYSQERLDPKLNVSPDNSAFRWRVESGLVTSSTPAGEPVGAVDPDFINKEYAQDTGLNLVPKGVDVASSFDPSIVKGVYDGTKLIWPTKFQ